MFKRKGLELISINDGEGYFVDKAVRDYIYKLRSELLEAREKESKLQSELDEILPVLEKQELKPAIGPYCGHCIYCVMEPKRYKKGDMFVYNGILHQFTSDEISLEEDSFMYEPDYSFIPKSFWEDLRKEVEKSTMEPVNFNRPENIRQEFWDKIDDMAYMIGKSRDISLSLNLTPDGVLNANVYPWPEDEDDEDEDFEGEEWK